MEIPKCQTCGKKWIKIKEQSGPTWSNWKSGCDCLKDIRLSIG